MFSFLNRFKSIEKRRLELCSKVPESALKHYLSQPLPDTNLTVEELNILSVDFETTGLNPNKHKLLSIGGVDLVQGKIKLNNCFHQVINIEQGLRESNVVIHQITDTEKDRGITLKDALDTLLIAMTGKVLLVHYAQIERQFFEKACLQVYGVIPPILVIDTLAVIKKRFDTRDTPYDPSKLRLANLRKSYHLPSYSSHNALTDAISTAELLLVEIHQQKQGLDTKLRDLL